MLGFLFILPILFSASMSTGNKTNDKSKNKWILACFLGYIIVVIVLVVYVISSISIDPGMCLEGKDRVIKEQNVFIILAAIVAITIPVIGFLLGKLISSIYVLVTIAVIAVPMLFVVQFLALKFLFSIDCEGAVF